MPGGHQNTTCSPKLMLGAHKDDKRTPKSHVLRKINAGCPPRCQASTKMPHAHQKKHWVSMKMLGGQRNSTCSPKETLCGQQKKCQLPTKMPCANQNKCHVLTKRKPGCPPKQHVATKTPHAHKNK